MKFHEMLQQIKIGDVYNHFASGKKVVMTENGLVWETRGNFVELTRYITISGNWEKISPQEELEPIGPIYSVQEYRVHFNIDDFVLLSSAIYHQDKRELTEKEIIDEAVGYLEVLGMCDLEEYVDRIEVLEKVLKDEVI